MKRKTMSMHSFYASSSITPPQRPAPPPTDVEPELEPTNVTANPLPLIVVGTIPPPERPNESPNVEMNHTTIDESTNQPRQPIPEFHPSQIISDPGLRIPIEDYAPEIRSDVRRAYLLKGRNKAIGHNFEKTKDGRIWRSFQPAWFDTYDWLEYSVEKEAAFCFHCFLFKKPSQAIRFGNDVFTKDGYTRWKTALSNFRKHVGGPSSYHNIAKGDCDDFNNQRASVATQFRVYSKESEISYKIRLTASLDCARYLIAQGEAFRGHDESSTSINKGNFRELLDWYKDKKEDVKEAFDKGPGNAQMICSDIQKDLATACAMEVTKVIKNDIGDKNFSILIDEARDCSIKEQMAVIVRFLDDHGVLQERFLAIKHITDCTSAGIKKALVDVLEYHGLSTSRLRGQGYDGASNMRGEFNGLQKLVRDEAPYAFYVHCFAHQLQLVVVNVAQCSPAIADFFNYIPLIVTQVCSSCKRKDALLAKHQDELLDLMENGKITAGTGLHQESNITRPGDTRWGSHLKTLLRIFTMWNAVVEVLGIVVVDAREHTCQGGARGLLKNMECFEFVFIMLFLINLLSNTSHLSQALQTKNQNIVEAMRLILDVKESLQSMRDNGWEYLFCQAKNFCETHGIDVPNMDDLVGAMGQSVRTKNKVTRLHYYKVSTFNVAIDATITEMNHRFNEVSTELLDCMSCLNPANNFSKFNVDKLIRLAEIYDEDFTEADRLMLGVDLPRFLMNIRRSEEFNGCRDVSTLARLMVETMKHTSFQLVYRLIELTLILPVATSSVERIFSAMKIIKTDLRNKLSDDWLNDLMVCYCEKEIFRSIPDDQIMIQFQKMRDRKGHLPHEFHVIS
uniref:TTF-type domain-containing protein n=2 Tax=Triticum urartu TaxID=4572 RepID=A0A8R7Q025_TRIUA